MKRPRRNVMSAALTLLCTGGCVVRETIVEPSNATSISTPLTPVNPSSSYSSITGSWRIRNKTGFGNNQFEMTFSANVNFTQTNQLAPGYTRDVYLVTGTFSDLTWLIQRKRDGHAYLLPSSYGLVANGAINTSLGSHNLQFNLGSQNFAIKGVAPGYASMWGDATLKVDMTRGYGTADGTVTITGMWEASRK